MNGNNVAACIAAAQAAFPASNGVIAQRIQFKRVKGFRLQEVSQALNGLPAVLVTRASRWGNPFTVASAAEAGCEDPQRAVVDAYRIWLWGLPSGGEIGGRHDNQKERLQVILEPLRGKNLACACDLAQPCHADVLLALANVRGGDP